jgi:hypothetical protein
VIQQVRKLLDLPVPDCTHLAKALSQNQIGTESAELSGVDCNHWLAGFTQPLHLPVDLRPRSANIHWRGGHPREMPNELGKVAFVGDSHQQARVAQSSHHLGGGRQQADHSHLRRRRRCHYRRATR